MCQLDDHSTESEQVDVALRSTASNPLELYRHIANSVSDSLENAYLWPMRFRSFAFHSA